MELQDRQEEFGIADIQLGLTTLEEVFLNIARDAELETAAAEETFATLQLNSVVSIQVIVIALIHYLMLLSALGIKKA